jgi:DNA-binding winged helix-turn-helix (wHTH) protein
MIYAFSDFELDEECYELRRASVPIKLEPKVFQVMAYLIQHRERVVTKDELLTQFWPGQFVTESALAHCIVKARQAVDDGGTAQRVIKTVHGHGYRFIAAVVTRPAEEVPAGPPAPRSSIAEEVSPPPNTTEPLVHQPRISLRIPEGERKQATVLAVGVKGIPTLAQALDPEVLPTMLRRLFDLIRVEVQRVEGRVSLVTGNGLRAVFGVPIAHEDHAVRADRRAGGPTGVCRICRGAAAHPGSDLDIACGAPCRPRGRRCDRQ